MREWIAGLVLIGLLLGAFVNLKHLDALVDDVKTQINHSQDAYASGNSEEASRRLAAAYHRWQRDTPYTNIFLRHPEIDAISDAFWELSQRLQDGEAADLSASYALLLYHLNAIDQMEHPWPGSIL